MYVYIYIIWSICKITVITIVETNRCSFRCAQCIHIVIVEIGLNLNKKNTKAKTVAEQRLYLIAKH